MRVRKIALISLLRSKNEQLKTATVGAKKKLTLRFRCTEQKGTKLRRSRNETIKRKHETKRKSSKTKRNYIARAARDCAIVRSRCASNRERLCFSL